MYKNREIINDGVITCVLSLLNSGEAYRTALTVNAANSNLTSMGH